MKKKITVIFLSFFIFLSMIIFVSAVDTRIDLDTRSFGAGGAFTETWNQIPTENSYIQSGYAGIVCGPRDSTCILTSRVGNAGDPYIFTAVYNGPRYSANGDYLNFSFSGRIYFNGSIPEDFVFYYIDSRGGHDVFLNNKFYVYSNPGNVQACYYTDVFITVAVSDYLDEFRFQFRGLDLDFCAFSVENAFITFSNNPNGAQVEANSMIAEQNSMVSNIASVITGSVNTAPLTSGVNNIVGNVTSMIPDTTDIPYVSEALGSLTQLTNIAAAEIGGFFDPFFSADMSVTVAGVTFNPFLTFLFIVVVITSFTYAIKIFTRGDHER